MLWVISDSSNALRLLSSTSASGLRMMLPIMSETTALASSVSRALPMRMSSKSFWTKSCAPVWTVSASSISSSKLLR